MITGNSLKIAKPNSSDEMLLSDAPEGQHNGFWLNINGVVTSKDAIPAPGATQDDVDAFLEHALGAFLLEDRLASGPKGTGRPVYDGGATGLDLRRIHKFVTRTEVECDLLGKAILAATDYEVNAKVYVPFEIPWALGTQRRPGHTQMRHLFLKVTEKNEAKFGGAGGDQWTRKVGAFFTYEVEYDCQPGTDRVVEILTLARAIEPRKSMRGPGGLTVLGYETTPLATTALKQMKVRIGDGEDERLVHDVRDPDVLAQQFKLDHQDAEQDITDDGTPFYWIEEGVDLDELPHGPVTFEQVNQDLAPMNGRFLYYPEHDSDSIRAAIGNAAKFKGRPLLGSSLPITNPRAHRGAASTAVIELLPVSDAKFVTEPGIMGLANGQTQTVVPPSLVARAASQVNTARAEGANVAEAAARRLDKVTALRIPGATDSNGRGKGTQRADVRGFFKAVR